MKTARKYTKHNKRFWNGDHYFTALGIIWLALMTALVIYQGIKLNQNTTLISPVVLTPMVVEAKESVRISCDDVIGYIRCKYYQGELTEEEAITMIAIGKAESGLRENAKNKVSTARGVFQIVAGTWYSNNCVGDPWNWKDNTNCAIKIMKSSGYYPWDAYNRGMHKQYLNEVTI